jgi:hypothetical protein
MQIRPRLEAVIEEMLDGHIMLDEALASSKNSTFKGVPRNKKRISTPPKPLGSTATRFQAREFLPGPGRKYHLRARNHRAQKQH